MVFGNMYSAAICKLVSNSIKSTQYFIVCHAINMIYYIIKAILFSSANKQSFDVFKEFI